jgi:uncharacterized protein
VNHARHTPVRTCIGCRVPGPPVELHRWVAPLGQLVLESDRNSLRAAIVAAQGRRGRGAWLHARSECVGKALKSGAVSRAFRKGVQTPAGEEILGRMQSVFERKHNAQGETR